jgi:hypothetical protein
MDQNRPAPPESPSEPQPPPVNDPPIDREPVIDEPGREVPAIDPRVPGTPRKIDDPKPNPESPGPPATPEPTPVSRV